MLKTLKPLTQLLKEYLYDVVQVLPKNLCDVKPYGIIVFKLSMYNIVEVMKRNFGEEIEVSGGPEIYTCNEKHMYNKEWFEEI